MATKQTIAKTNTATMTRVDRESVKLLDRLSKVTGRTRTHIANEAIKVYVRREIEEVKIKAVERA